MVPPKRTDGRPSVVLDSNNKPVLILWSSYEDGKQHGEEEGDGDVVKLQGPSGLSTDIHTLEKSPENKQFQTSSRSHDFGDPDQPHPFQHFTSNSVAQSCDEIANALGALDVGDLDGRKAQTQFPNDGAFRVVPDYSYASDNGETVLRTSTEEWTETKQQNYLRALNDENAKEDKQDIEIDNHLGINQRQDMDRLNVTELLPRSQPHYSLACNYRGDDTSSEEHFSMKEKTREKTHESPQHSLSEPSTDIGFAMVTWDQYDPKQYLQAGKESVCDHTHFEQEELPLRLQDSSITIPVGQHASTIHKGNAPSRGESCASLFYSLPMADDCGASNIDRQMQEKHASCPYFLPNATPRCETVNSVEALLLPPTKLESSMFNKINDQIYRPPIDDSGKQVHCSPSCENLNPVFGTSLSAIPGLPLALHEVEVDILGKLAELRDIAPPPKPSLSKSTFGSFPTCSLDNNTSKIKISDEETVCAPLPKVMKDDFTSSLTNTVRATVYRDQCILLENQSCLIKDDDLSCRNDGKPNVPALKLLSSAEVLTPSESKPCSLVVAESFSHTVSAGDEEYYGEQHCNEVAKKCVVQLTEPMVPPFPPSILHCNLPIASTTLNYDQETTPSNSVSPSPASICSDYQGSHLETISVVSTVPILSQSACILPITSCTLETAVVSAHIPFSTPISGHQALSSKASADSLKKSESFEISNDHSAAVQTCSSFRTHASCLDIGRVQSANEYHSLLKNSRSEIISPAAFQASTDLGGFKDGRVEFDPPRKADSTVVSVEEVRNELRPRRTNRSGLYDWMTHRQNLSRNNSNDELIANVAVHVGEKAKEVVPSKKISNFDGAASCNVLPAPNEHIIQEIAVSNKPVITNSTKPVLPTKPPHLSFQSFPTTHLETQLQKTNKMSGTTLLPSYSDPHPLTTLAIKSNNEIIHNAIVAPPPVDAVISDDSPMDHTGISPLNSCVVSSGAETCKGSSKANLANDTISHDSLEQPTVALPQKSLFPAASIPPPKIPSSNICKLQTHFPPFHSHLQSSDVEAAATHLTFLIEPSPLASSSSASGPVAIMSTKTITPILAQESMAELLPAPVYGRIVDIEEPSI